MELRVRLIVVVLVSSLLWWSLPATSGFAGKGYSKPYSGVIDFGLNYDDRGKIIVVTQSRSTFGPRDTMAYVAHLTGVVRVKKLHWTIVQLKAGQEIIVLDDSSYPVKHPKTTNVLYNRFQVAALEKAGVKGPGNFIMRFARGKAILAQGTFSLAG